MYAPRRFVLLLASLIALALAGCGGADAPASERGVRVGVAANFASVCDALAERFTAETGIEVVPVVASTGKLYAQIVNGAPLDVLLAADAQRPERLVAEGHAVAESRFAYAHGRLALTGRGLADGAAGLARLQAGDFEHLAIAHPETAPYGAAAKRALEQLGLWSAVEERVVYGESVGQTWQFVSSGGAELGFVALAQVLGEAGADGPQAHWLVPDELHEPIRQEAVLVAASAASESARAWLDFLRGPAALEVIEAAGYRAGDPR